MKGLLKMNNKILFENVIFTNESMLKNNYNALEIKVDYQKDGYNMINGKKEAGGVYVYFQPMTLKDEAITFTLFDDTAFKIKAQELTRKNQNKINSIFLQVQQHKDLILDLFIKNRRQDILNLIKSFAV